MKLFFQRSKSKINAILLVFGLTALLISVATYAWFIGVRTVNISSFDIEIATTDSLLISLDGKEWSDEITINEDNFDKTYLGNTNSWGGRGLYPISSVGEMDKTSSRLVLFEKAGITATPGGYRLLASKVNNQGPLEKPGYVAFDLFVKNFSGRQYIKELNLLDEEALYLTDDSEVGVATSGVPNTGIENSVRMAFAQVGRVVSTTIDPKIITSITCTDNEKVTGICRNAAIWEPNDTNHVSGAISWYKTSCKKRIGLDVRNPRSYSGNCNNVIDGFSYPTYAINSTIYSRDNIDIYDGNDFNGYNKTVKLTKVSTFTDTMKNKRGVERHEIFTLAPKSITKVRVYIYLEGQDIDNYEYAQIGKRINMQFGFTKERFSSTDINYEVGEDGNDIWKPVITIDPDIREITIPLGEAFTLPAAVVIDKISFDNEGNDIVEDITRKLQILNTVDTTKAGTYYVTYNVSDWSGNYADQIMIKVIVE